jgi:hypothetical protein
MIQHSHNDADNNINNDNNSVKTQHTVASYRVGTDTEQPENKHKEKRIKENINK